MAFDKGREKAEPTKAQDAPTVPSGLSQEQLMAMFLELQARQLALTEQQTKAVSLQEERSRPKENPNYQAVSLYLKPGTGEGTPWAADLKCDIFIGPIKLNRTPLTEAEVTALNRLQPIENAVITKMDRSTARAKVQPSFDAQNRLSKLVITLPMSKDDNPQMYPPLDDLANQLADQAEQVAA